MQEIIAIIIVFVFLFNCCAPGTVPHTALSHERPSQPLCEVPDPCFTGWKTEAQQGSVTYPAHIVQAGWFRVCSEPCY